LSGICGIVRLDAPADAGMLERMTSWLTHRGPDGHSTWLAGEAGLGHTLLDTSDGRSPDRQPCTLDGRCWIVADARIDARAELVASLEAAGERVGDSASDAQLVLHAWRAWGEACPERLLGDFAFAIWDAARRTLFCARDHLGVKPFFHAQAAGTFLFASSLACLRRESSVADAVDETAIADFLLFESAQDPGATVFTSIRRLAPAHCLALSPSGLRIRRYWQLPRAELAAQRSDGEWLEQFDEVLGRAVADRVRSSRVAVLMSGGLDSPALASVALARGAHVKAFSSVYDHIIPDDERRYSSLAARFIGIPIQYRASDDYGLFERYRGIAFHFPEPVNAPFAAADIDLAADAAEHSRVALTGWDGDALLSESPRPYFGLLAARRQWLALASALGRFAIDNPASAARSVWLRVRGRARVEVDHPTFPVWLNESFVTRMRLRERWADAMRAPPPFDPLRPYARLTFDRLARISTFFEAVDASRTGVPLEMRHPFFDLRVVGFCLSLPTVPWCIRKEILRRWLRGRVPEAVRRRPKTPLGGFPHLTAPRRAGAFEPAVFAPCAEAAAYLDRGKMASMAAESNPAIAWANLRAPALDLWLRHARTT
jgi:asparagine synthase (glutamine-hydrolysing)